MINFTVGPVQSTESVRAIGAEQVPYFRTPEFSEVMLENERMMKEFTHAEEDARVVFITGSGTASMEAAVMNFFDREDKVLVVNGGSFGARFVKLCEIHEIPFTQIRKNIGEALKEEDLRREETEAQSKIEQEESIAEKAFEAREEWTEALKESRRAELANQTRSLYWDGPVLTRSKGSVYGPSGKETYYNLNMSGCVRNMNRRGYYYEVWVRNDGCKMFGDYIMCAANLGVHPFGSLVECSLGTCIVVDTGGFAAGNPNQLDIAVTW